MKQSILSKALCTTLAFLLLLQALPLSVFANDYSFLNDSESDSSPNLTVDESLEIVCEVVENRSEYTKEFLLEDGTYYSITTIYPMHILDNGEWENSSDILDNTANVQTVEEIKETILLSSSELYSESFEHSSIMALNEGDSETEEYTDISSEEYSYADGELEVLSLYGMSSYNPDGSEKYNGMYELVDSDGALQILFKSFGSFISENKIIESAKLSFTRYQGDDSDGAGTFASANVLFYEGVEGLQSNPARVPTLEMINSLVVSSDGDFSIDITDTCNQWDLGNLANHGIVIRPIIEDRQLTDYFSIYNYAYEVYYKVVDKNDLDFTYHIIDMGEAGTVYINNYTNSILAENTLINIDSNVLPITLSRIVDGTSPVAYNYPGYGLSWNSSSILVTVENDEKVATWKTFSGESLLFVPETNSTTGEFQIWRELDRGNIQDNSSINLYIPSSEIESGYVNYSNIYLKQGDTTYHFDNLGRVVSVTRPNSNNESAVVSITYDATNSQIKKVIDENGISYDFTYERNNLLRQVYMTKIDVAGSTVFDFSVSRDTNYTNTVSSPIGESISYIFNTSGKLLKVINENNECWEFEYVADTSNKRVLGYTKTIIDNNGNETEEFSIKFNTPNGYYREIEKTQGDLVTTEIIQYDRNHRIITHKDFNGKYVCVEYDKNGIVSSYAFNENANCNQIIDGSFENIGIGAASTWNIDGISTDIVSSSFSNQNHGEFELKLSPTVENELKISQVVEGTFTADNTYVIGAWVKVNKTIPIEERIIGIEIKDTSGDFKTFVSFDNGLNDEWQYRLQAFKLPNTSKKLEINLVALNQSGDIRFDEITLFEAVDSQTDLNNIVTSSPTKLTYNEDGTINSESMTDGVYSMSQSYVYDRNGKIIERNDINGLTEYYKYSSTGKWIGTTKDSDGDIEDATQLIYDSYGILQTVSKTIHAVTTGDDKNLTTIYNTVNGKISSVKYNHTEYFFEYNPNGTVSNVSVSIENNEENETYEDTLVEYGYTGNSNIGYISYSNGYEVDYTYDSNGNITLVECLSVDPDTYETTLIKSYEYSYSPSGELLSAYDSATGYTIVYSNDGYSINTTRENETESIELYSKYENENGEIVETFRQAYHVDESENLKDTITTSESNTTLDSSTGNVTNTSTIIADMYASDDKHSTMTYARNSVSDYFNRIIHKSTSLVYETGKDKTYNVVSETNYEYQLLDVGVTSGLISEYTTTISGDKANPTAGMSEYESYSRKYEYDHRGNVKYVYVQNGTSITSKEYYEYDEANQLVTAINFNDGEVARYTYDSSGNLASKVYYNYANLDFNHDERKIVSLGTSIKEETFSHNATTIHYTYPDKTGQNVTSVIELDKMGNPKNYVGIDIDNAIVTGSLEWNGNLLTKFENSNHKIEYEYDLNGYRSTKTVYDMKTGNGVDPMYKMTYIWDNGVLTNLIYTGGDCEELSLNIIYDQEGSPVGYITSMGLPYYFIKDVNENVVGLVHADGTLMYSISYDAWGTPYYSYHGKNILEDLIIKSTAIFNPITYHGYIYDYETGMYCSQGRCYSPVWGRYINPENPISLNEYSEDVLKANLYLFSNNNPISNVDPYASWSRDYIELGWNARGFNVEMNELFSSRSFCTIFANQFLKKYGEWDVETGYTYLGMDSLRIASDLFAHYVGKNAKGAINKVNASWGDGWLLKNEDSNVITIKNNDANAWKYEKIWYAAPEIKAYAWSNGIFITL